MNLKKSITTALENEGRTSRWLINKLGMHEASYYRMLSLNSTRMATLEILASVFGMKVSEFVALGEDE